MIIWVKGVGSGKTKSSSRVEGHGRDLPPQTDRERERDIFTLAIPEQGNIKVGEKGQKGIIVGEVVKEKCTDITAFLLPIHICLRVLLIC
ncbi:hypothetical protein NPIL_290561 [Nephila pilipes]|uniref:Uncharacterized protein n=1 Tax=Nephila pilipes TaxID=299642 RepID=A0A8X6URT2_NEPPI|nr:hypothetical protein NPIL_290561 [Nephila pilipes]